MFKFTKPELNRYEKHGIARVKTSNLHRSFEYIGKRKTPTVYFDNSIPNRKDVSYLMEFKDIVPNNNYKPNIKNCFYDEVRTINIYNKKLKTIQNRISLKELQSIAPIRCIWITPGNKDAPGRILFASDLFIEKNMDNSISKDVHFIDTYVSELECRLNPQYNEKQGYKLIVSNPSNNYMKTLISQTKEKNEDSIAPLRHYEEHIDTDNFLESRISESSN